MIDSIVATVINGGSTQQFSLIEGNFINGPTRISLVVSKSSKR